jgi:hypothetical protein
MIDKESVIAQIHEAFDGSDYPGDAYLQGSFEGCEPYEEVGFFKGKTDWRTLDAAMLDTHAGALSFFSEAGFRFFLPAYLIADVRGELQSADPLFYLTSGFFVVTTEIPASSRVFIRKSGGSVLLNPKRYGAMTFCDYARFRLSVFTKEETKAIVTYLRYRREIDPYGIDRAPIDAALNSYWLDRSAYAPSRESLESHLREEDEFLAQIGERVLWKT